MVIKEGARGAAPALPPPPGWPLTPSPGPAGCAKAGGGPGAAVEHRSGRRGGEYLPRHRHAARGSASPSPRERRRGAALRGAPPPPPAACPQPGRAPSWLREEGCVSRTAPLNSRLFAARPASHCHTSSGGLHGSHRKEHGWCCKEGAGV